jgi:hypothetical protein
MKNKILKKMTINFEKRQKKALNMPFRAEKGILRAYNEEIV